MLGIHGDGSIDISFIGNTMHVLILPSWYPTRSDPLNGVFFREQAQALVRNGVKVGILHVQLVSILKITKNQRSPLWVHIEQDGDIPVVWFNGFRVPRCKWINTQLRVFVGNLLFHIYMRLYGKPEILHVQSMVESGPIALSISKTYKIPYVVTEHSSKFARNMLSNIDVHNMFPVVAHASNRMAVSRELATLLQRIFTNTAWLSVPNMVPDSFFITKNDINYNSKKFRFICIALLTQKKGINILLEAFNQAFMDNPEVEIVIGGDGPDRQMLENIRSRLPTKAQIYFLGKLERDEVILQIQQANSLVVSSLYETFGVVIIEALALGRPVVATKCGGPESILELGDGYLVNPGSVQELADGMRKMVATWRTFDPKDITERCRSRYSEKSVSQELIKIYHASINQFKGE